jgi:hypothetical protein
VGQVELNPGDTGFTKRKGDLQGGAVFTPNVGNGKLLKVEEEREGSDDAAVERARDPEDEGSESGAGRKESDNGV